MATDHGTVILNYCMYLYDINIFEFVNQFRKVLKFCKGVLRQYAYTNNFSIVIQSTLNENCETLLYITMIL